MNCSCSDVRNGKIISFGDAKIAEITNFLEHCSCEMSDELDMVNYITEENKRRKRRRIVLMKQYFESTLLVLAYLSTQRVPRDLGTFTEDEHRTSLRK